MMSGLESGIDSGAKNVERSYVEALEGTVEAGQRAMRIRSPSRVTYEHGEAIGEGLKQGIENVQDSIVKSMRSIMENLTRVITDTKFDIWDAHKAILNGLLNHIERFANSYINGVHRMVSDIAGLMSQMPDAPTISMPGRPPLLNLPRLARGGIVDSATIAMIGESGREAVVPLENNTEWMRPMQEVRDEIAGMKGLLEELIEATNQRRYIQINRRTIAEEVTEEQRSMVFRTGTPLYNE
jgi:hypothetical protein